MTDIYESHDQGKTIYVRKFGSTDRHLLRSYSDCPTALKRWYDLQEAFVMAEKDTVLNDLISQLETLYNLKK
jgi:hypothetical protein